MSPSSTQTEPTAAADLGGASVGLVHSSLRVSVPKRRRIRLSDLWTSRHVGFMLGLRDIKAKYKQSALGPLWLVLQPLGMLAAVSIAFSKVTTVNTGGVPYITFALVGLAVWTYVQMAITVAPQVLQANYQVVRRSPCPRLAFVTGTLISVLPPLAVVLTASIVAAGISGTLSVQALAMPILVAWLLLMHLRVHAPRHRARGSLSRRGRDGTARRPGRDLPDAGRLSPQRGRQLRQGVGLQPGVRDHREPGAGRCSGARRTCSRSSSDSSRWSSCS